MQAPASTVDWKRCTSYVTLSIALYDDGTYGATLTSYYGEPRRWRRHRIVKEAQEGYLAPPVFAALQEATQAALDMWYSGKLD